MTQIMKTALLLPTAFFPPLLDKNAIGIPRAHSVLKDDSITNLGKKDRSVSDWLRRR